MQTKNPDLQNSNDRLRYTILYWLIGVVLATLAVVSCILWIDEPVAFWCAQRQCPRDLFVIIDMTQAFGHTYGVFVGVLLIYCIDDSNRRKIPRLLLSALTPGMLSLICKICITRTRPTFFDFSQPIWNTFCGFFPGTSGGHSLQSFPSGHTATAFGFALGLAWIYPKGKYVFISLATLVAVQRIVVCAHFPSDTLAGFFLAVGLIIICYNYGPLPVWLDRFERTS